MRCAEQHDRCHTERLGDRLHGVDRGAGFLGQDPLDGGLPDPDFTASLVCVSRVARASINSRILVARVCRIVILRFSRA